MLKLFFLFIALNILLIPIYSQKTLTIAIDEGYPPYYFQQDNKITGLCPDIVNEVAKTMDIEVVYKKHKWQDCLDLVKKGKVDAVLALYYTDEREKYLYFYHENALAFEVDSFFVMKNSLINFDGTLQSIKRNLIGIIEDYSYGGLFDKADFLHKISTGNRNEKDLLRKLKEGRVNMIVGSSLVIKHYAKEMGLEDEIRELSPFLYKDSLFIAFSKKAVKKDFAEKFAVTMKSLHNTKAYQDIFLKYCDFSFDK